MPRAFVLMTVLPVTRGHLSLIEFAKQLDPISTTVIISTQPHEPWVIERVEAIADSVTDVNVIHIDQKMEQNPEAPGFWDMWRKIMIENGFNPGDYIVASEPYGVRLAAEVGGVFMPYDINRDILPIKATRVRKDPLIYFADIAPNFQKYLRKTITIFGAESTGKTTLSKNLISDYAHWIPEWARPYLETVGPDITTESMTNIWHGQAALQRHAQQSFVDKAFIVQDTDLFSTVGYWDFWDMQTPAGLVQEAIELKSDLYIITKSNIPFEADPIRYGGDKREATDEYWIDLAKRYDLNHVVLEADDPTVRNIEAFNLMAELFDASSNLNFTREFNA